jgi:hypothetical protein
MIKFQCQSVSIEYIIVGCGSKVRNTCVLSQDKVFPLCYPEYCERYDIEVHLCYQLKMYSLSVLTSMLNSVLIPPANHFQYELSMLSKPL